MGQPSRTELSPSPSLDELVRITDVATELRRQRETVQQQLDLDETKTQLRERLLAAAKVTGENLTAEEVDAAIERYYDSLHGFQTPKLSIGVALAHLYVRRLPVAIGLVLLAVAASLGWWLWLAPNALLSSANRQQRALKTITATIDRDRDAIQAITREDAARARLNLKMTEAEAYRKHNDTAGLQSVADDLAELRQRLEEEYTIYVVSRPDEQSAVDRFFDDEQGEGLSGPAYYLIVEARTPQDVVLTRRIHSDETDVTKEVTKWGQRVPPSVYERLEQDKLEDGMVNESEYAVKRSGYLNEQVTLPDDKGQPVANMGRITEWPDPK